MRRHDLCSPRGQHLALMAWCVALLSIGINFPSAAVAGLLSDQQLYFDPDSFGRDFYPRVELADLAQQNQYVWSAGGDPIVGANILPSLRPGTYPPGYGFSQADYDSLPNANYFADLTGGNLTTTFQNPGVYHVRVTRQSGAQQIYALFAETALAEKDGYPDETWTNVRLADIRGTENADAYLVEQPDEGNDDGADSDAAAYLTAVYGLSGVRRIQSRASAVSVIQEFSRNLGRKIHVELVGHGVPGNISTGAGTKNIPDKQIDPNSVNEFMGQIRDYVREITFISCSVGAGEVGLDFLRTFTNGGIGKAGAYTSKIYVSATTGFYAERHGIFYEIPEPSSLLLLLVTALVARSRRAA